MAVLVIYVTVQHYALCLFGAFRCLTFPRASDATPGLDGPRIQAALAAMAETEFFVAAPRLHGLLCFLVETSLAEPGLKITQRLVAHRFLGKGSDFDPTIDPVVRVAIGRLRVALERYDAAGLNASVRFEIPRGGDIASSSTTLVCLLGKAGRYPR